MIAYLYSNKSFKVLSVRTKNVSIGYTYNIGTHMLPGENYQPRDIL